MEKQPQLRSQELKQFLGWCSLQFWIREATVRQPPKLQVAQAGKLNFRLRFKLKKAFRSREKCFRAGRKGGQGDLYGPRVGWPGKEQSKPISRGKFRQSGAGCQELGKATEYRTPRRKLTSSSLLLIDCRSGLGTVPLSSSMAGNKGAGPSSNGPKTTVVGEYPSEGIFTRPEGTWFRQQRGLLLPELLRFIWRELDQGAVGAERRRPTDWPLCTWVRIKLMGRGVDPSPLSLPFFYIMNY